MHQEFHNSFIDFLVEKNMPYQWIDLDQSILFLPQISLYVQWMGIREDFLHSPMYCQNISLEYQARGEALWRIWEDQWVNYYEMFTGRLMSMHGKYISVFARKSLVKRIDKATATAFLLLNHTLANVSVRYKYGLFYQNELVAVACFSNPRNIIKGTSVNRSSELVRFACKKNHLVAGGLSKLIKAFTREVKLDDIVTYADIDFSIGQGYRSAGFVTESLLPPQQFSVDINLNRIYINHKCNELRKSDTENARYFYNGGSQKWILFPILEVQN